MGSYDISKNISHYVTIKTIRSASRVPSHQWKIWSNSYIDMIKEINANMIQSVYKYYEEQETFQWNGLILLHQEPSCRRFLLKFLFNLGILILTVERLSFINDWNIVADNYKIAYMSTVFFLYLRDKIFIQRDDVTHTCTKITCIIVRGHRTWN